jgi:hypothetical protein
MLNPTQVGVNLTQVYVNPTQVGVNPTQVHVNPTQVYANPAQLYVNPTQVGRARAALAGAARQRRESAGRGVPGRVRAHRPAAHAGHEPRHAGAGG